MGRINIIKLIIYDAVHNATVWGRNIRNKKQKLLIFERSASKFKLFHKSQTVFQRVKKKLTFSSWGAPLLRRWWQKGGYQRWPLRSSQCGLFVSLAPLRQVCEWLLLQNIVMHEAQLKSDCIKLSINYILLSWHEAKYKVHIYSARLFDTVKDKGWFMNTMKNKYAQTG